MYHGDAPVLHRTSQLRPDGWGPIGDIRGDFSIHPVVEVIPTAAQFASDDAVHFGDRSIPEQILDPIGEPLD